MIDGGVTEQEVYNRSCCYLGGKRGALSLPEVLLWYSAKWADHEVGKKRGEEWSGGVLGSTLLGQMTLGWASTEGKFSKCVVMREAV